MSRGARRRCWFALIIALLGGYALWCRSGRQTPAGALTVAQAAIFRVGVATGKGNFVAIQPVMSPADYASEARFASKMSDYFAQAQARGMLGKRTVVILPEYLGTWLVVLGEKQSVYAAPTITRAMTIMLLSNPLAMARALLGASAADRLRAAIFHMKAPAMAGAYQRTFSRLAARYRVTILAGSIVLPAPQVRNGILTITAGPLQNIAVLYCPDGRADPLLTRKVDLTAEEQRFLVPGATSDLPVYATSAGRLGVLLCADAWFPENYRRLRELKAEVVAVPSFITGDHKLATHWRGYDGAPTPTDVDAADVSRLSMGQAWRQYALIARLHTADAPIGIHCCLRGHLWNLGSDGITTVMRGNQLFSSPADDEGSITDVEL